jgi:hypothetical protein
MRTMSFLAALLLFTGLAVSCTVEVDFEQVIDIPLEAAPGMVTNSVRHVVGEAELKDSLSKGSYALSEFDSLVLLSATIRPVADDGWTGVSALTIAFLNDVQSNRVFTLADSGTTLVHNLTLLEDNLLSLFQGKSFFVDLVAPGLLLPKLRIHLEGPAAQRHS